MREEPVVKHTHARSTPVRQNARFPLPMNIQSIHHKRELLPVHGETGPHHSPRSTTNHDGRARIERGRKES